MKTFIKKDLLNFAEHCMLKLVSKKPNENSYPEVSSYNLYRIKQILKEFK